MAVAEEGPEPLRYQTLALKVSIHCEGCKKKVKKVLHSIEGVYKTDIDIQHQKVVVIGNVSVDTLIKKLVKTGKHAEPWPEPAPFPAAANPPSGSTGGGKKKKKNRNKNPANNKPAEAAAAAAAAAEGGGGGPIPQEKHDHASSCDEASDDEPDKPEGGGGGGSPKKLGAGDAHDGGAGAMVTSAMTPHGKQPIAPTANGNGGGGKKKGKKGGNGNGNANANGDGTGAIAAMVKVNPPDAPMKPTPVDAGPVAVVDAGVYPPGTAMSYPVPVYYAAGGHMPPPYAMSYSTAHPLRSSAYYHPMVGAAYTGGVSGGGGYFYSTAPVSAAPGSYYMFSEENANACSVM